MKEQDKITLHFNDPRNDPEALVMSIKIEMRK